MNRHDILFIGFEPDIISYSTYMKGLCRNKKSAKAYGMYLELKKEDKHQLDEVFFNLLLDGLSKDR
jgi:pentatricopeptide repeat protein